jgi:hypothetical protein
VQPRILRGPARQPYSYDVKKPDDSVAAPRIGVGTWLLVLVSSAVAVLGLAAVWAGVSLHFRSPSTWMLVVVSLDAALLLRLAGMPPGRLRLTLVLLVSVLTLAASALLVSASQIGMGMGMPAQYALPALSPGLVALYLQTQLGWSDALWLLPATWLGWRFGR